MILNVLADTDAFRLPPRPSTPAPVPVPPFFPISGSREILRWQTINYGDNEAATQGSPLQGVMLEETYHTFSYVPLLPEPNGGPAVGFLGIDNETTDTVIAQRRLATLRELTLAIAPASDMQKFYDAITSSLRSNPIDVPFLMVYSCNVYKTDQVDLDNLSAADNWTHTNSATTITQSDEGSSQHASSSGTMLLRLRASVGLRDEYRSLYRHFAIDLEQHPVESDASFPLPLHQSLFNTSPLHAYLVKETAEHFLPRSWDQLSHQVVVAPIKTDRKSVPEVILVMGLNSRRGYTKPYRRWIEEVSRALGSGMSSVKNLEREQRHLSNLKKLDQVSRAWQAWQAIAIHSIIRRWR